MEYSIVILCAGLGSRFRNKTKKLPKGLLKLKKKELLLWQLENIFKSQVKIKDFHIVTGFKSNLIENFYKKKIRNTKLYFHHNKLFNKTGCISSFFIGIQNINNNIIYFNSDLIISYKALNKIVKDNKNYITCRKKKYKKSTILQDVMIYKNKVIKMDLNLKEKTYYEAVGPVKFNTQTIKKMKLIKKEIRRSDLIKLPCYSFFGKYAKNLNLNFFEIKDKEWHEFNNVYDLISSKKKKLFST